MYEKTSVIVDRLVNSPLQLQLVFHDNYTQQALPSYTTLAELYYTFMTIHCLNGSRWLNFSSSLAVHIVDHLYIFTVSNLSHSGYFLPISSPTSPAHWFLLYS